MHDLPAQAGDPLAPAAATRLPGARTSELLSPDLLEPALDAGRDRRQDRAQRADGWTAERVRIFLNALAECGVVGDAARAAGMSVQSARRLRNRTANRAFHLAWAAAEQLARRRLASDLMSRALHGCVELVVRDGKVLYERHRFDNRLTLSMLTHLERQADAYCREAAAVGMIANEFDQFVDIVCDEGKGAAEFISARQDHCHDTPPPSESRDACLVERADNYRRYGVGLPGEIPAGDLDPAEQRSWTEEQQERARRSGLLGAPGDAPGAEPTARIVQVRRILDRSGDPPDGN